MSKFLLFFITITIAEVFIMKEVAERIGYMNLLFLVLFTGFLGIALAKQQGREHLMSFQQEMSSGKMPGHPVIEGLMILIAGVVLLTPGFLTDILGFSLLVPPIRKMLSPLFVGAFKSTFKPGKSNFTFYSSMGNGANPMQGDFKKNVHPSDSETFDMPEEDKKLD
ncbi:MAG: FxsA family protein [Lentisphaeraceae bacterium]|nr:FxsA family protein [Lentisphaeraceae bacterium]